jgi:hypothetical protein
MRNFQQGQIQEKKKQEHSVTIMPTNCAKSNMARLLHVVPSSGDCINKGTHTCIASQHFSNNAVSSCVNCDLLRSAGNQNIFSVITLCL